MGIFKRIRNEIIYLRAALRSLKRLGDIYKTPNHTFVDTVEALARTKGKNVAIYFEDRKLTYSDYNGEANRYARWALSQGIGRGDVVAVWLVERRKKKADPSAMAPAA